MALINRNVIAAGLLALAFISNANAWGCPPWLPCGKHKKLITPDSEYGSAVSVLGAAEPVILQPQMNVTQYIDTDAELIQLDAELLQARMIADRLNQLEQINRPTKDLQIVDWGALPR